MSVSFCQFFSFFYWLRKLNITCSLVLEIVKSLSYQNWVLSVTIFHWQFPMSIIFYSGRKKFLFIFESFCCQLSYSDIGSVALQTTKVVKNPLKSTCFFQYVVVFSHTCVPNFPACLRLIVLTSSSFKNV